MLFFLVPDLWSRQLGIDLDFRRFDRGSSMPNLRHTALCSMQRALPRLRYAMPGSSIWSCRDRADFLQKVMLPWGTWGEPYVSHAPKVLGELAINFEDAILPKRIVDWPWLASHCCFPDCHSQVGTQTDTTIRAGGSCIFGDDLSTLG